MPPWLLPASQEGGKRAPTAAKGAGTASSALGRARRGLYGDPGWYLPVPQLARAVRANRCFQALPAARKRRE